MNKIEFIDMINTHEIDDERVKRIKNVYKIDSESDILMKLISAAGEVTFFDEERRALTFDGIIYAGEDLNVDFVEKRMIPVIDAYDLNYIVYLMDENKWGIYNIEDDVVWDFADDIIEIL